MLKATFRLASITCIHHSNSTPPPHRTCHNIKKRVRFCGISDNCESVTCPLETNTYGLVPGVLRFVSCKLVMHNLNYYTLIYISRLIGQVVSHSLEDEWFPIVMSISPGRGRRWNSNKVNFPVLYVYVNLSLWAYIYIFKWTLYWSSTSAPTGTWTLDPWNPLSYI